MKNPARFRLAIAPLALALLAHTGAHALTGTEKAYVGGYTSGSVDTRSQLMLLDDNTFCFTFMGGSLDMLVGGHWKAEGAGIRLKEQRPEAAMFPVFGRPSAAQDVEFDFHGYTLSNASRPVFAVSDSEATPATLRPLFAESNNSWSESYKLPPLAAGTARYFFVGAIEPDRSGKPPRLKVLQFRRGDLKQVRIGFNTTQAEPPLDLAATLKGEVLHVDGSRFGKRDTLSAEDVASIRQACVRPALAPATPAPPARADGEAVTPAKPGTLSMRNDMVKPVKTFYLDAGAIQGEPFFGATK